MTDERAITIVALYQFAPLGGGGDDHVALREPLFDFAQARRIKGTLLLAGEGINGTVAGDAKAIAALIDFLESDPIFGGKLNNLEIKYSHAAKQPFKRLKVRLKKEIVTLGMVRTESGAEDDDCGGQIVDPNDSPGTYVEPEDWNALIDRPDVKVIDTRNDYEVNIGTFCKASGEPADNPNTETFRAFPDYVQEHLDPERDKHIAMFCTGGIRCEKATAYMKQLGFENVYHLKGGILKYMETVEKDDSRFAGECYVFDDRVSVDHELQPGNYKMCYACGRPVSREDEDDPHYRPGVACPACHDQYTPEQRARFEQRQRQIELEKTRRLSH